MKIKKIKNIQQVYYDDLINSLKRQQIQFQRLEHLNEIAVEETDRFIISEIIHKRLYSFYLEQIRLNRTNKDN